MSARKSGMEIKWPSSIEVEKLVLGGIISSADSAEKFVLVSRIISAEDFWLNKHRVIFQAMRDLYESGTKIDRVTLIAELDRRRKLEAVDGMSYIVSLDEGMPEIINLEQWAGVIKEKAELRSVMSIGESMVTTAATGTDAASKVAMQSVQRLLEFAKRDGSRLIQARQFLDDFDGGPLGFIQQSGRDEGLLTGFTDLDERTGGLRPGELVILAARPSMGKTALALNIAGNVALGNEERRVAFFSLEMSNEALLVRLACSEARITQRRFRAGVLNQAERLRLISAVDEIYRSGVYIDDSAGGNLMEIHSKLLALKAEGGLDLVVIDYLQLMRSGVRYSNRVEEVSQISRGLKLMAKDLGVPFLVLSQLSRAPEMRGGDRRPQLSDLRESGSIEQDADSVWFIYRPEYYKPDREDLRGVAELIIGKQRNGPTGVVKLVFIRELVKFESQYYGNDRQSKEDDGERNEQTDEESSGID